MHRRNMMFMLGALASFHSWAQTRSGNHLTIIVPFPPGGSTDIVARGVALSLMKNFGWTVVVENKSGAGGSLGLKMASMAKPDGSTIVLGQTSNLITDPLFNPGASATDLLTPIIEATSYPMVLIANLASGIKDMQSFQEYAKTSKDGIKFANVGTGTVSHLSAEDLARRLKINVLHVPYKGNGPAMNDLIGGQVDVFFSSSSAAIELQRTGKVSMVAVASKKRMTSHPDVPTVAETLPGYEARSWNGFLLPKNAGPAIVKELNARLNEALASPDFVAQMERQATAISGGSSEDFKRTMMTEKQHWAGIVKNLAVVQK